MSIIATLHASLAHRQPARSGPIDLLLKWLLPEPIGPAAKLGSFAAAMTTLGAQDPVLFAEWLRAEENLAEERPRSG